MTKDQWTVTGLLAILLFLEVIRSSTVKSFLTNAYKNFSTAISK